MTEIKLSENECIIMTNYKHFIGTIYVCEDQTITISTFGIEPLYNIQVKIKDILVASYWCNKYERSDF